MKKVINIIFSVFVIAMLSVLAVSAPIKYMDSKYSADSSQDKNAVGNMPLPERSFEGFGAETFSALDRLRYQIDYTYLNYLPYSFDVIKGYSGFKEFINKPVYLCLELLGKNKNKHETNPGDSTESGEPPIIKDEERLAEYLSVPEGAMLKDYKIEYLTCNQNYRYYLVTLFLDNGEKVEYYDKVNISSTETLRATMKKQLAEVNRLAASDTDVNFVVYIPTSFQLSEYFNNYYKDYAENQLDGLLDEYLGGLDKSVTFGSLNPDTLAERANNWYLTDHHWSSEGVYKGYTDIIELFRKESNDVLPALYQPQSIVKVTPCKFYGSYAREIANDSRWDDFVIYDYKLPEHRAFFGGVNIYKISDRIKLLADTDVKTLSSNAYGTFYPQVTSVSYPENKTGRNLLILGDSYTRSIAELVASSFDNTYSFYYCGYSYNGLDYNKFIKDNNITDVLYMQYSERALFDYCGDAALNSIITTERK